MKRDRMPLWFQWTCVALFVGVTGGCEIKVASTGSSPPAADPSASNGASSPTASASGDASKSATTTSTDGRPTDGNSVGTAVDTDRKNDPQASADTAATEPAKPDAAKPPPAAAKAPLPIESTSRRAVSREAGIEVITFDDLNIGMQADMVFRDFLLTDRVKELDGQRVRLIGYIHGGVSQLKDLKEFVLLRNTECKFGPGGQADHLVRVILKDGVGANYSTNAIQIEGILKVAPFQGPDGNTWSVYDLAGDHVKTIRK